MVFKPTNQEADITAAPNPAPEVPEEPRCPRCLCIYCCCPVTSDPERLERELKEKLAEIDALSGKVTP